MDVSIYVSEESQETVNLPSSFIYYRKQINSITLYPRSIIYSRAVCGCACTARREALLSYVMTHD
jgi:hypothetical protein